MLIRREQMMLIQHAQVQRLERDLVVGLKVFHPDLSRAIGDTGTHEVVRIGITKAASYGLTECDTVRLYVELMFTFGSHFDTDPQYQWAAEALQDPLLPHPLFRAAALHRSMLTYFEAVAGPGFRDWRDPLQEAARVLRRPSLPHGLDGIFRAIHPRKCDWLGTELLEQLAVRGMAAAREYGVTSEPELALLALFAFLFGHRCIGDPIYPWIQQTLTDAELAAPAARFNRLIEKCLAHIQSVAGTPGRPAYE